jgi:hypothetical protein
MPTPHNAQVGTTLLVIGIEPMSAQNGGSMRVVIEQD